MIGQTSAEKQTVLITGKQPMSVTGFIRKYRHRFC